MAEHVDVGTHDEEEYGEVEAMENGHRVLPAWRSVTGDMDGHTHT